MIPGQLQLGDGSYIDSFALAVARSVNYSLVRPFVSSASQTTYGSYISNSKFDEYDASLSAHVLLNTAVSKLEEELKGRAILVGGHWSTFAYHRGRPVDMHTTPVGAEVGPYIHANFAEALLDSRTFVAFPLWVGQLAEILFALVAMLLFAASNNFLTQLAAVAGLSAVLIGIEWSALHQFGVFFDAFIPVVALWLHSVYERLLT
jgi:CHASE2 domain-containing sensor protein